MIPPRPHLQLSMAITTHPLAHLLALTRATPLLRLSKLDFDQSTWKVLCRILRRNLPRRVLFTGRRYSKLQFIRRHEAEDYAFTALQADAGLGINIDLKELDVSSREDSTLTLASPKSPMLVLSNGYAPLVRSPASDLPRSPRDFYGINETFSLKNCATPRLEQC